MLNRAQAWYDSIYKNNFTFPFFLLALRKQCATLTL